MKLALIRRRASATGGAELYVERLMSALMKRGHEVHLFAEQWPAVPSGVRRHEVPSRGGRAFRPVRFAAAVEEAVHSDEFDVVFSLERTRRQDVYRAGDGVHAVWLERRRQFAPWWKRFWIGRSAFHRNLGTLEHEVFDPARTGRIIVNSGMVRREILANFPFPEDRIDLVRNGVDVGRFRRGERAAARTELGLNDGNFLLLFVGSGFERKGLRFLLRLMACPEIRSLPIRLLVVTRDRVGSTSSNVIVRGPRNDVEQVYAAADLFTLLPIYEPSANVVFEARAAGLPVITSAYNGAAEILREGETGTVLADPSDTDALLQAVLFWHRRWAAGGGRIESTADSLSLERNVEETLGVMERAADDRKRAAHR